MLDGAEIQVLGEAACFALLVSTGVGRVGATMGALPAIFPVRFTIDDAGIVFRVSVGAEARAVHDSVIAFQADRVEPTRDEGWHVLVVGPARRLTARRELARAEALDLPRWPRGQSSCLVRLEPRYVSGRRFPGPPAPDRR